MMIRDAFVFGFDNGSSSTIILSVDLDCSLKSSPKNSIKRLISVISDSVSDRFGVSGVAGS